MSCFEDSADPRVAVTSIVSHPDGEAERYLWVIDGMSRVSSKVEAGSTSCAIANKSREKIVGMGRKVGSCPQVQSKRMKGCSRSP